jgi:3-dehydroquinate synthase
MYKNAPISINSSSGGYSVLFQKFGYNQLLNESKCVILMDKNFAKIAEIANSNNAIEIQPGEGSKDISEVAGIMALLAEKGVNKDTKIVAIGGGTIQDLATFVSSTYMRGIAWTYYPTTLQAMADSCIGGKSAINVGKYKNLVGNYHPPREVYIDATLVSTLSNEDITCGLLEAMKIAYAGGEESTNSILKLISEIETNVKPRPEIYENIIATSLNAKKYFIEKDEFDKNARKILNFGHTYGHVIEAASDYKIHHGLAIGIGMLASFLHREQEYTTLREEQLILAIRRLLKPFAFYLREEVNAIEEENFQRFIQLDKKVSTEYLRFIHSKDGRLELVNLPNNSMTQKDAFNSVIEAVNAL